MNVSDWIKKWSLVLPDKVAIIDNHVPITYGELNNRINSLSNYFVENGLCKGDRVAALLHNSSQFMEIFFAVSKIGAIIVPLNFRLTAREIKYIINDCSAETLFFDESFIHTIEEIKASLPVKKGRFFCVGQEAPVWSRIYQEVLDAGPCHEPAVIDEIGMETPHIIMYTSGTTGSPKGAILSHGKTFFNILNASIYYHVTPQDKIIVSRPMFHSGGLLVDTLPFLYNGACAIIKERFSPKELLDAIQKYSVTVVETSATMYRFILEQCNLEEYDLSSVKCFFTGGERVPLALLRSYKDKGIIISQVFGQTETSITTWLPIEYAQEKIGSVGIPVFHGEVRIVDKSGNDVNRGQTGEIVVSGPILMSGYWGKPELTRETIENGWLHTGDLGRQDEDGFYYILDREKNMFISGGENVYPAEIESVLIENPNIATALVFGVPDQKWGEAGKACIVPKKGRKLTPQEVTDWCIGRLAKYKIPEYIEFVDAIPENAAGKIIRGSGLQS